MLGGSELQLLYERLAGASEGDVVGGGTGGARDPEISVPFAQGLDAEIEHLPAPLYRGVMHAEGDDAAACFEQIFERNGWPAQPAQWSSRLRSSPLDLA